MRLSAAQVEQILDVIKACKISNSLVEIYLFGSRADDALKGGDIDLLLVVSDADLSFYQQAQFKILNELKKQKDIGDRKIDLHIATSTMMKSEPFLIQISPGLVTLGNR